MFFAPRYLDRPQEVMFWSDPLGRDCPFAGSTLRCQAIQSAVALRSAAVPATTAPLLFSFVMLLPPEPGIQPLLSEAKLMIAVEICRMLLRHLTCRALSRALFSAGSRMPISSA